MFNKKRCTNCGKKISDNYNFCPYCRSQLNQDDGDWGMLGKSDFAPENNEIKMPFGFNALFNTLIKNLDKQFSNLDNTFDQESDQPKIKKSGVSISINTSNGKPPEIKVRRFGGNKKQNSPKKTQTTTKKTISRTFSKKQKEKFKTLSKKSPDTNVRRLSDRVIYELKMPGVKNEEDVSINQLKESIEIKAIGNKKAYNKIISVSLPIRRYTLSKGVLALELDAKQ